MGKNYIRLPGKKRNLKYQFNIYVVLWTLIIIGSVYLLLRFAAISFSEEIGQAKLNYRETALYYIGDKAMESGSALIGYMREDDKETDPFPFDMIQNPFAIKNFVKDKSRLMARAKEYSLNDDYVVIDSKTGLTAGNDQKTEAGTDIETMEIDREANDGALADNPMPGKIASDQEASNQELSGQEEFTSSIKLAGIKPYSIDMAVISREYILTNGAIYDDQAYQYFASLVSASNDSEHQLEVGLIEGDLPVREQEDNEAVEASSPGNVVDYTLEQLKDINFLIRNFYIVDPSTIVTDDLFDAEKLLGMDMKMKQENDAPQILIYHTHSQETYSDSRQGEPDDTVVGMGSYLTQILEDRYHYNVIHDTSTYDIIDGLLDRNKAYNKAEVGITKILEENPSIEVVIDLHRDGVDKRSTILDGEETAQIMLFNGLSRNENGPLTRLDNPNLQNNLAFSLQLQLKAVDMYPGLFYKNYLQSLRYNMHVRPKCLLMELGTYKNSLQSAKNAMEPFAEILNAVLQGQ